MRPSTEDKSKCAARPTFAAAGFPPFARTYTLLPISVLAQSPDCNEGNTSPKSFRGGLIAPARRYSVCNVPVHKYVERFARASVWTSQFIRQGQGKGNRPRGESSCALAIGPRLVHSAEMGDEGLSSFTGRARARSDWSPAKVLLPSQLDQVAAVCYRIRGTEIEFLLVKTRKGRWTFPKGGSEPGLTHAQAAALEAFEEAGVRGRIEEVSFTRYRRVKRPNRKESAAATVVHAYLCEVVRLGPPQELNRSRTWFSPYKAKAQLGVDRESENGTELARVVDCAVARIQRLRNTPSVAADPLQRVHFEASPTGAVRGRVERESLVQHFRGKRGGREDSAAVEFAVNAYLREMMQFSPAQLLNPRIALLASGKAKRRSLDHATRFPRVVEGTSPAPGAPQNRKVIQIDRLQKPTRNG